MAVDKHTIPNAEFRDRAVPPLSGDGNDSSPVPYDENADVTELWDGSALVHDAISEPDTQIPNDDTQIPNDDTFYDNLVEDLPDTELVTLATTYLDLIDRDIQARKKRDEQYEEGIRRTGLGNDAPGGAQFSGASKTVHPVMAEACIDFEASAIKELFPPMGPVKTYIIGESNEQDVDRADRKRQYMNWQLTKQMPEYRPELERLLTQLPLGGSQYQKFRWVDRLKRPESEFVPIDNIIIPFSATSFYGAQRVTHRMYLTEMELEERVNDGLYEDPKLHHAPANFDISKSETATEKIEGKTDSGYNEDGLRVVYEIHTWLKNSIDKDELLPYILTIDEYSRQPIALYRNWDPEDAQKEKLDWIVDWTFIPWRGALGIGLPHLIGGLAAALTGSLRALLDSAHIANAATLVKLKGSRLVGQTTEVQITGIQEVETPPGVDDIRKLMMSIPFPGPSPVLFQLLGWLTDAAKGVITTAEEKISDASNSMPVGTAMALIESGSKVFSAIHGRLHAAHAKSLEILHRINGQYLDDQVEVKELGKLIVSREDFQGSLDVIPVSDPSIFSETQRFSQVQALMQMQTADAQDPSIPWDKVELRRRFMHLMHVEDPDKLLPKKKEPITGDPITENVAAANGEILKAQQDQDHAAHIVAHLQFIISPIHAIDPGPDPTLGAVLGHCREHLLMLYKEVAAHSTAKVIGQHMSSQPQLPGMETVQ